MSDEVLPKPHPEYFYFVDGVQYPSAEATISGAVIRSSLPETKRNYALFEESDGNDPDKQVTDDMNFFVGDVGDKKKLHFYTVPAATFGAS